MSQGSSNQKTILRGLHENDATFDDVHIDEKHALQVAITNPLTAFGELKTVAPTPVVQFDAVYGLRAFDTETFVDSSPGTGTATAASSLFTVTTGVGVGGYGVIRSKRVARYRPGQGLVFRGTAMFTAGVANSLQGCGLFTSSDGLMFGYDGTTFGVIRRLAGAAGIYRLTVTVGATGAEVITITLNGTAFVLPATAGALTTAATAEYIAEQVSLYTGWTSSTSPKSNGSTVTFIQGTPGSTAGSFTLTSGGGATGTFATVQAGSANTLSTIAQTAWNVDVMDGSNSSSNPSGILLDKTKLNVYQIVFPYLGAGPISWWVFSGETSRPVLVHITDYSNNYTIPNQKNPTMKCGWIAESLGSSTDLTVKGASAAIFVDGHILPLRNPVSKDSPFTAGTTKYVAIAFRVRGEFAGIVNQTDISLYSLRVGVEASNRIVRVRVILNPVMTGTVDWQYVDQTKSIMEYATPTTLPYSNGTQIAAGVASSGSEMIIDLHDFDAKIEPGDVIAIAMETASGTTETFVALNWQEN